MENKFALYLIPISLLFIAINAPIILGAFELWFNWNFTGIISFIVAFLKVLLFLAFIKTIMAVAKQDNHPLVLAGVILGVIIMFLNSYYANYQYALYQKIMYGKAVEVKASDLYLKKDLYKTPYVKITNSGIGTKKFFEINISLNMFENNIRYCYASILNTKEPTVVLNQCGDEKDRTIISLQSLANKSEIVVEMLPKKSRFKKFNGGQFYVTQKSFEDYYKKKRHSFLNFVYIINAIGVFFSLVFFIYQGNKKSF